MNLPNKISELLTMALNDLLKVEKLKDYTVDMAYWHTPSGRVCLVCLAGCVIVEQKMCASTVKVAPGHFNEGYKLRALDRLRSNMIHEAVSLFYGGKNIDNIMRVTFNDLEFKLPNRCNYVINRRKFLRTLRWLARKFKAAGY